MDEKQYYILSNRQVKLYNEIRLFAALYEQGANIDFLECIKNTFKKEFQGNIHWVEFDSNNKIAIKNEKNGETIISPTFDINSIEEFVDWILKKVYF